MLHRAIIGFLMIFMTLAALFCFIVAESIKAAAQPASTPKSGQWFCSKQPYQQFLVFCSSTFSSGYSSNAVHDAEDDTADDTEECSSTFSSGYSSNAVHDAEDDTAEFSSMCRRCCNILTSFLILVIPLPLPAALQHDGGGGCDVHE